VSKFQPKIKRGDIVVFRNQQTNKIFTEQQNDPRARGGFVKRVVGVAGDTLKIENGYVYLNDKLIAEPYILKGRSTFGSDAIRDCQEVTVPNNKYLVLGDNRKVSVDSRQIGMVETKDIYYYLPFNDQVKAYANRWRDTADDDKSAVSSELDAERYLVLLNVKRVKAGREELKLNTKLTQSAKLRAQNMLKFDDTSFEATRSGYTMEKSMAEVGYDNIVYGEFPIVGYYDAQELIDAIFEYPNSKDYMLERDYQEIGVSTFVGQRNGCPVQIVVQHLAGYKPPNYSVEDIEEWKILTDKLEEIKGGWVKLKNDEGSEEFYESNKKDIDRVNEIIQTRQDRARAIIKRMEANEWFTSGEQGHIEQDKTLFDEQNEIAERLNKRIRGE
jgi:signal peptidase I